jgi:hypothetical protein
VMQIHIRISHVASLGCRILSSSETSPRRDPSNGQGIRLRSPYVLVHMSRRAPALSVRTILGGRYLRWA